MDAVAAPQAKRKRLDFELQSDTSQCKNKCFHGFDVKTLENNQKYIFGESDQVSFGYTSKVYKVKCSNGCSVAIKSLQKYITKDQAIQEKKTLEFIARRPNPNMVEYFGHFLENEMDCFIFEFCEIDLDTYLEENAYKITSEQLNNIVVQIGDSLTYLCGNGIYHPEFALKSMMWKRSEDKLKLIDFGGCLLKEDKNYTSLLSKTKKIGFDLQSTLLDKMDVDIEPNTEFFIRYARNNAISNIEHLKEIIMAIGKRSPLMDT